MRSVSGSHFRASKIQITDLAMKKVAVQVADEKMFTICGDRDFVGRLLLAAKVGNVDIKEVLSFQLASFPISINLSVRLPRVTSFRPQKLTTSWNQDFR